MVDRIYVEKRKGFDVEAQKLTQELQEMLDLQNLIQIRIINRYDCEGISKQAFDDAIPYVFSEPQTDHVFSELPALEGGFMFAVELLPGQFDQRAESAAECIQLISQGTRPYVRYAKVYLVQGNLDSSSVQKIKDYIINPVETRETSLEKPVSLVFSADDPSDVATLTGFITYNEAQLKDCLEQMGLAMDLADITFFQNYFRSIDRDPTITELKVVDTYWSDHCRHTTFSTHLTDITIDDEVVQRAFDRYLSIREELGRQQKPLCLMDMATIGSKWLQHTKEFTNLDESDEINACCVREKVCVDGELQDWLFLFKNETHNHPTEIEPFGGAATCIGGAIRDPLSGRSYVYQAMRVTGAGNPLAKLEDTIPGKLPQRKLTRTAAHGYSSYGNQIGLATGQVSEIYHPGYTAKRMEVGAVVGATPQDHVRREVPAPGDVVVLLGGATGRDGIGGATGSSKVHKRDSLSSCGAEVQKGNAPTERKLQRLFRRKDATCLIKRCNDFGAGGVSVAIGELADGLLINLDCIPKKYEGLDGTELAISESQERMAVVLAPCDVDTFLKLAQEENLEATQVAVVSEEPTLKMQWRGKTIVDISHEFLSSSGATKTQVVHAAHDSAPEPLCEGVSLSERMSQLMCDLNVASTKGLGQMFDSTIGAATVLMPYGGTRQLTEALSMVAKLPVDTDTKTVSGMAWGFNPYIMEKNQFKGAYLSVVESVSKLVATGFKRNHTYLSLQEYFERLGTNPERWGKPFKAVLGALMAQVDLGVPAIGGKDSMSGSFEDMDVPPTLISFAASVGQVDTIVSPEFKKVGSQVICITPHYDQDGLLPDSKSLKAVMTLVENLCQKGYALSVSTPGYGGMAEALFKMCLGNRIGFSASADITIDELFAPRYGTFIVELKSGIALDCDPDYEIELLGVTLKHYEICVQGQTCSLEALQHLWEERLQDVFPYKRSGKKLPSITYRVSEHKKASIHIAKPRVIIPVFPGTNCEFDTARAFRAAGADPHVLVIRNLTPQDIAQSCEELVKEIAQSQIIMLPGGFSGGDEPDGSAKFIASFFRNPAVTEAVRHLLHDQDGLMLGICNGFQALIKLGLVPYGDICDMNQDCPTLTYNTCGNHISRLVHTRVASNMSPWMSKCEPGEIHTIAISHGEGRFVASPELVALMAGRGQIACQYTDADGTPSMDWDVNPNGSVAAIEAITSPDGRILGKMGHSERAGYGLYKNVEGNTYQPIIEGGVSYFTD